MAVFKIEKQKNYIVMSNYHLQDKTLSFKAKGLLSFMLSLPEDWDYSMKGLVAVSKENLKAIRSILNELKDHGYLEINQTRGDKGYYKYEYIIREIPLDIEKQKDNPDTQKGNTAEGDSEKEEVIGSIINNQLSELKKIATEEKFRKVSKRVDDLTDYFSDFTHRVFTPNGVKSDDEDGDIISEGDTIADDLLFKVMGHNGRSIELPVDISYLKNYCLSTCISPKQLYNSLVWIALRLVAISFCIKELKVEKVSSKKSSK